MPNAISPPLHLGGAATPQPTQVAQEVVASLFEDACREPCPLVTREELRALGYALNAVRLTKSFGDILHYWHKLRSEVGDHRTDAAGAMVRRFLKASEGACLQHAVDASKHVRDVRDAQFLYDIAAFIGLEPYDKAHKRPATKLAADLFILRAQLGDPTVSTEGEMRARQVQAKLADNKHVPAPPAPVHATPIPGRRGSAKGGREVSSKFRQGVKTKYRRDVPLPDAENPVLYRRLRAIDEPSQVYTVSETVEMGSFGKFRLAVDGEGKEWGIKEFRIEVKPNGQPTLVNVSDPDEVIDEIELLNKLKGHLHVKDVFAVNEKVFVVMPLMDGDMVNDLGKMQALSSWPVIVRSMCKEIIDAVVRLHDLGYMHRDIKADNVFWNGLNQWALGDVGLAFKGDTCDAYDRVGTLGYVAPEVLTGTPFWDTYGQPSDIFSLGLLLCYAHAGSKDAPFWNTDLGNVEAAKEIYNEWREKRLKDDGSDHIDWEKVKAGKTPYDKFAQRVYFKDEKLADMVFNFMLRTDPADRQRARKLQARIHALHRDIKPFLATAEEQLATVAEGNKYRATLDQLRIYSQEAKAAEDLAAFFQGNEPMLVETPAPATPGAAEDTPMKSPPPPTPQALAEAVEALAEPAPEQRHE